MWVPTTSRDTEKKRKQRRGRRQMIRRVCEERWQKDEKHTMWRMEVEWIKKQRMGKARDERRDWQ